VCARARRCRTCADETTASHLPRKRSSTGHDTSQQQRTARAWR
jgi:hypothetical protein